MVWQAPSPSRPSTRAQQERLSRRGVDMDMHGLREGRACGGLPAATRAAGVRLSKKQTPPALTIFAPNIPAAPCWQLRARSETVSFGAASLPQH